MTWVFSVLAGALLLSAALLFPTLLRDETVIEGEVARLVNEERDRHALNPLVFDSVLGHVAETYSKRMLTYQFFWHNRQLTEDEAFRRQPIDSVIERYGFYIAENIVETPVGFSSICGLTLTNRQIAKCMVELWRESKPHYTTMLGTYSATGVGVACDLFECKGTQYFTPRAGL
ncbi:CAP domain-containing protein [Candidatus Woesearchaeota archaeon]|nr:MAG: CAP domain-containing protein [Candidatus Woesearchaeota archaeon]